MPVSLKEYLIHQTIKLMIEKTCEGIDYFISHNMNETMNKYNNKLTKGKND